MPAGSQQLGHSSILAARFKGLGRDVFVGKTGAGAGVSVSWGISSATGIDLASQYGCRRDVLGRVCINICSAKQGTLVLDAFSNTNSRLS